MEGKQVCQIEDLILKLNFGCQKDCSILSRLEDILHLEEIRSFHFSGCKFDIYFKAHKNTLYNFKYIFYFHWFTVLGRRLYEDIARLPVKVHLADIMTISYLKT